MGGLEKPTIQASPSATHNSHDVHPTYLPRQVARRYSMPVDLTRASKSGVPGSSGIPPGVRPFWTFRTV